MENAICNLELQVLTKIYSAKKVTKGPGRSEFHSARAFTAFWGPMAQAKAP